MRHPEDEAKEECRKVGCFEWGGHWKVRLFCTFRREQTAVATTGVRYSDTRVALLKSSEVLRGHHVQNVAFSAASAPICQA